MTPAESEIKSKAIELATNAFDAFCDDISGMFGIDMKCVKTGISTETTKGLSQKFKKTSAVTLIKSEGVLNGTFHTVFDQAGMFALAGIIIMLPKQKVMDDMKRGSAKDAEAIADTIKETGNLLVGSWDRVFREEMEGHGHFLQATTYIGNPWDKSAEKIGIPETEQFQFAYFQMTIDDYPTFTCGAFFPEAIFLKPEQPEQPPVAAAEKVEKAEEPKPEVKAEPKIEKAPEPKAEVKVEPKIEKAAEPKPEIKEEVKVEKAVEEKPAAKEIIKEENKVEEKPSEQIPVNKEQPIVTADVNKKEEIKDNKEVKAETKEPPAGPVSETIQKMMESSPHIKDSLSSLRMCAKDVMQTDVLFGSPEDSVQDTLAKMQQAETSYMIIGNNNLAEGIISTYDLASAVSVYLKPVFAKWRRPEDDATLQIKVKWIMTKPVKTVKGDTSVAAVMDVMCQTGLRCMPVVSASGKVEGLITVYDILRALLQNDISISSSSNSLQRASA
jgi:CBS domain-containing protein